jgi:riboflavin synthase
MFTGIIESLGHVVSVQHGAAGARITLRLEGGGELELGESVAVNGACLTVAALSGDCCRRRRYDERCSAG